VANLQTLALYLAADIEVENPAWGRGRLVGLPHCFPYDRSPSGAHANVRFLAPPPNEVASGIITLSKLKPVLYELSDRVRVLATHPNRAQHVDVLRLDRDELERMAAIVDTTRALGIALNLPPTDYIRKELP
jgi:hypothetical protein